MFHGDDYFIGDEQGPSVFALLKRLGDAFLVTTDCFGRATLRRYGFDDDRIVTLRLALAVKNVPFRDARPDDGSVRVLSVARLVAKKGLEFGIRAVTALQASHPELRLEYRIIGDGPLRDELSSLVRALGAERTVRLLGAATGAEVLQSMHESDIFLLPSLMEQAGYVLLEAQATGLPVVASRVGGVPEMVREGRSALLVEPGDEAGLAASLQRLLERRRDWPAMAQEGRRHVEEHHDLDRLTAQLETVLRHGAAVPEPVSPVDVLFIEYSMGLSGSTMSLCTLLNHLDEKAFRPHVVVSRPEQAESLTGHLRGSVDIEVISPGSGLKGARWLQRALGAPGGRLAWLKRLARRVIACVDIVAVEIPYALRLRRFARRRGIALIHQNNGFDLGAIMLAGLLRTPLIAYQRGGEWDSPTVRRLAPRVSRYIANSAATREVLLALGIPAGRVSVIYPPLDLADFDHRQPPALSRSAFGLEATTPCFGIVGILLPWKGQVVFLKAARRILDRLPNARAVIVGGSPAGGESYEAELKGLARELGIADRVIFTGFRADVPEILKLLDIVVHASITPEPFGRVIVEAMAMRRPVVASRAGGPLEIIEDNRNGFLVPPGDDEALAARVIALLEDRALSARIAEAAYQDVVSRFSAERHARDVQQIYDAVLDAEPGTRAQRRRADQARRASALRQES
jgi:glycosyltransferase involved in cell wall biosynthesis